MVRIKRIARIIRTIRAIRDRYLSLTLSYFLVGWVKLMESNPRVREGRPTHHQSSQFHCIIAGIVKFPTQPTGLSS